VIVSDWPGNIEFITVFTEDLAATRQFYVDVFGLAVMFEDSDSAVFKFGNTHINLLKVEQAPELIDPAPIAAHDAGSRFVFTLPVDDVDAKVAELTAAGVTILNGPMDRPWGIRTASFVDPAGCIWEIAK
jgi:lactoylglutathione lyase